MKDGETILKNLIDCYRSYSSPTTLVARFLFRSLDSLMWQESYRIHSLSGRHQSQADLAFVASLVSRGIPSLIHCLVRSEHLQ